MMRCDYGFRRKANLAVALARTLRADIFEGVYAPHTQLPTERELADAYGVGRGYVRMALATLADEGLVKRVRGQGSEVQDIPLRKSGKRFGAICKLWESASLPEGPMLWEGITNRFAQLRQPYTPLRITYEPGIVLWHGNNRVDEGDFMEFLSAFDAVVCVEASNPVIAETLHGLHAMGKAVVVANLENEADLPATRIRHKELRAQSVEILAGMGHTRIGYVGRDLGQYNYQDAFDGFTEAMGAAHLEVRDEWIRHLDDVRSLKGYLAAQEILNSKEIPTAIIVVRDILASGVIHAIEERGLKPGYDISVISFDNTSWPEGRNALTTYHAPYYEMGVAAVDMLTEAVEYDEPPSGHRYFDAPLRMRKTVGLCQA